MEHGGGKLLAKGFLFGVGQRWSMAAGNCLRKFPIRREAVAEHGGGKLLADSFLFGVRQ